MSHVLSITHEFADLPGDIDEQAIDFISFTKKKNNNKWIIIVINEEISYFRTNFR